MESRLCSVTLDSPNNKISIIGFNIPLEINYLEDIDFTQLVKHLCTLFDNKININFQLPQDLSNLTEKERIIIETLKSIFNSFNENIIQETDASHDTEPDSSHDTVPDTLLDNLDDLPF
jgi:hypothetical protein